MVKRKRPLTFNDIPKELLPTIFGFLDTRSLGQVSQVSKGWELQTRNLLKVRGFSVVLRKIAKRKRNYQVALSYIQTHDLLGNLSASLANFSAPDYEFTITEGEQIVYIRPSLLHDLAQWIPQAEEEKQAYQIIFNKLLTLGANPNAAVTRITYVVDFDSIKKVSKQETVLETAIVLANSYLFSLLWGLYSQGQLLIENRIKLFNEAVLSYVSYDRKLFLQAGQLDLLDRNQENVDKSRDILLRLVEEQFRPDCSMLKEMLKLQYATLFIRVPSANDPNVFVTKSVGEFLMELYPGDEIERENSQLKIINQQQQQKIEQLQQENELLKKRLAEEETFQKEVEELREALKTKEQTESPRPNL